MLCLQRTLKPVVSLIFRVFSRVVLVDLENLPPDPPYIIFSNHISWFDPPLLAAFLPVPIHIMAMDSLFKLRPLGYVVKRMGGFPVRRESVDRRAVENAIGILGKGGVLCIFPEGGINRLARGEKLREGISLIAHYTNVPLVPVGLSGCRDFYKPWKWFFLARIKIRIGKPFVFSSISHLPGKKARKQTMERIRREMITFAAG